MRIRKNGKVGRESEKGREKKVVECDNERTVQANVIPLVGVFHSLKPSSQHPTCSCT